MHCTGRKIDKEQRVSNVLFPRQLVPSTVAKFKSSVRENFFGFDLILLTNFGGVS